MFVSERKKNTHRYFKLSFFFTNFAIAKARQVIVMTCQNKKKVKLMLDSNKQTLVQSLKTFGVTEFYKTSCKTLKIRTFHPPPEGVRNALKSVD